MKAAIQYLHIVVWFIIIPLLSVQGKDWFKNIFWTIFHPFNPGQNIFWTQDYNWMLHTSHVKFTIAAGLRESRIVNSCKQKTDCGLGVGVGFRDSCGNSGWILFSLQNFCISAKCAKLLNHTNCTHWLSAKEHILCSRSSLYSTLKQVIFWFYPPILISMEEQPDSRQET